MHSKDGYFQSILRKRIEGRMGEVNWTLSKNSGDNSAAKRRNRPVVFEGMFNRSAVKRNPCLVYGSAGRETRGGGC